MSSPPRPGRLAGQLRTLGKQSALYGLADVFTNLLGLLLLPLFTRLLSPEDYRVLAVLQLVASTAKILFRLGLDSAFLRVYYERGDANARRRLTGTALAFSAVAGALLFVLVALLAPVLTAGLFSGARPPAGWLVLVAADALAACFTFVPQALLRIEERAATFSALSILRHAVNLTAKLGLLLAGWGVPGVLASDLLATLVFALALGTCLGGRVSWAWDRAALRELLALGLPRVPHGLLVQAQNLLDRPLLDAYVTRAEVGLYHVGYTLGGAVKFALSAFEPAWQPFVYAQLGRGDAPATIARLVTPVAAVFVGAALVLAVLGRELVLLMTGPAFHGAAPVVPVVALAYLLHGAFLLTSIGIGIAKQARYYPLVTLASAATNVAANLILIPRWGMLGAAWATVASYALMAVLGYRLSRRLYPIPFEGARLARTLLAATAVYLASLAAPVGVASALVVKTALLAAYPAAVFFGVWTTAERRQAHALLARVVQRAP